MLNEGNHRIDSEVNRLLVEKEFFAIVKKENRMPTYQEVANGTGLSVSSVERHMKTINLTKYAEKIRIATDNVLLSLTQAAMGGQWQSIKLWFQIVHGWSEKRQVEFNDVTERPQTKEEILAEIDAILAGTETTEDSPASAG